MSGNRQSPRGDAVDERSAFDQRIAPRCLAIAASIVAILVALAMVAML